MTAQPTPLSDRLAGVLLGLLGVALCAVMAVYLTVRHVVWPQLDHWRPQLLAQVERQLGRAVSVDAIRPGWEGLHPAIEIDGLRLDGTDGEPRLAVASAYARISWDSIALGRPRLAALRLDAPQVTVERLGPGRIAVAGFELSAEPQSDARGLDWLLSQGELVIAGASVSVLDRTGELAPLRLEGVDAQLRNTGRRHQASLSIARPGDAADALSVVAEVYREPLAPPSDWTRWQGEAHASALGVELARVAALARTLGAPLPGPADGANGRLDTLAWLRFDAGAVQDATLKVRASAANVPLADGPLAFDAVSGEARLKRQRDGGVVLKLSGLKATDPRGFTLATDGEAELGFDPDRALRGAWVRLNAFDAAAALAAARRLPLPAAARQRLRDVGLAGEIRDLTLRWTRPDTPVAEARPADRSADAARARPPAPRFELTASFEHLGLQLGETADGRRLPGFGNLSGSVRASDRDGALTLTGRRATLGFPGVFDEPAIPFDRLDAEVDWTIGADARVLEVSVPRLEFANVDTRGSATVRWRGALDAADPGSIDIAGRVDRLDLNRVPRYLPRRLPASTREWVERAVLGGVADDVRFEVHGDLRRFPFRDPADGLLRVAATMRDGVLAFSTQWPRIEQIRGDLLFQGAGLEVRAQSATTQGVRLADVRVRLADYAEHLLTVEGRGAGPAKDLLRFVDASPLASTVSTFSRDLRVSGDARLGLALTIPLQEPGAMRVAGTVDLAGNDIALDSTLPALDGATGRLEFTERGITLPELRATFVGGPIRIEARPAGEGRMRIEASGSIDAAGMRRLVDNPLTRHLDGRTDYRASVEVDRRASTLRIESDLVGLSSTLPAPFAKPAAESWPLRVASRPIAPPTPTARPPGDRLDIRLRDDIAFVVEREREAGGERLLVRRAGFALDAEPALRDDGLSVLLRARSIDLDAWRAVLGDGEIEQLERGARSGTAVGMSLVPDLVSIVADDLRIAGRDLHEVVVGASRTGGRWRANIASREIEGHFDWRDARAGEQGGTLTARFARLALPPSRLGEVESALSASPTRLPGLDVTVDDLVLGKLPMGRLELSATNGGTAALPVWRLDRLVVTNPAARLEARGSWSFVGAPRAAGAPTASLATSPAGAGPRPVADTGPDARSTSLDFELEVRDAGRLLASMGLKDTVHGGTGSLGGRVSWHGSPMAIDYGSLDGLMQLAVGRGEFLKVEPGIAKLIGVLNMQSLPKRLSGDFRDLFGEGFAFDSIAGQVRIDRGIARTEDLRIRGLQAQVAIRGEADLQRETQRLNVEVVPELNAGLASLAFGAMINPIIGLGSFAAQYVLRKPLQDVLAYDIDVTGSWSDPAVSERNRRFAAPRLDITP